MALCQLWQAARLGFLCRFSFLSDQVNMGTLWKLPQFCLRLQVCDLAPSVTNLPSALLRAETWICRRALPMKTRPSRPARKQKREAHEAALDAATQQGRLLCGKERGSVPKHPAKPGISGSLGGECLHSVIWKWGECGIYFVKTGKLVGRPRCLLLDVHHQMVVCVTGGLAKVWTPVGTDLPLSPLEPRSARSEGIIPLLDHHRSGFGALIF